MNYVCEGEMGQISKLVAGSINLTKIAKESLARHRSEGSFFFDTTNYNSFNNSL